MDEFRTDTVIAELAWKEAMMNMRLAELEMRRSKAILEQRIVPSPVTGVVIEKVLSAGECHHESNHILTVAEIDPLNVEVFLPISYYGQVWHGMKGFMFPEDPVGGKHFATVAIVDNVIDASSGTFGVRLEFPNPTNALPAGLRCKVRFVKDPIKSAKSE